MSELIALGVSHRTAPLELRERLALTEGRAVGVLGELVESPHVHEAAAISTCNRTELYLVAADAVEAESLALGVLAREADIRPTELVESLYSHRATESARHLFRVAAGLDSMILGEAEIQGQVKRAYELALVEGATGPVLNRLFRGALATGKRARTETGDLRARPLDPLRRRRARAARRSATSPTARCSSSAPARPPSSPPGRSPRAASRPSSSPTATTTARSGSRSASAAARCGSTSCRRGWRRPTSSSPRPTRRTTSSSARSSSW